MVIPPENYRNFIYKEVSQLEIQDYINIVYDSRSIRISLLIILSGIKLVAFVNLA